MNNQRISVLLVIVISALLFVGSALNFRREPEEESHPEKTGSKLSIRDVACASSDLSSATITWRTNVPADSQAIYGVDSDYERATPRSEELTTQHLVRVTNLRPGRAYKLSVLSADAEGNVVRSGSISFTTKDIEPFPDACDVEAAKALRDTPGRLGGAAWTDFNNDGYLDVYIACSEGGRLFRNDRGVFVDVTQASGLSVNARAAVWGDYDRDGDKDLLVATSKSVVSLYTNDGPPNWRFSASSLLLPFVSKSRPSTQASHGKNSYRFPHNKARSVGWIDYNNDGWLDIIVMNGSRGISLFKSTVKQDAKFQDVTVEAGLTATDFKPSSSSYITLGDFDLDGQTDLLFSGGYSRGGGYSLKLAKNRGDGTFGLSQSLGVGVTSRSTGPIFGDYDNDGDFDIFAPQWRRNGLYQNTNGSFANVISSSGELTKASKLSLCAAWGDVDNDGDLDLYVGNTGAPNNLYVNNGDCSFADYAEDFGVQGASSSTTSVSFVDFDNDGDLDIFVGDRSKKNHLYVNTFIEDNNHNYLAVKLGSKAQCVGAVVKLFASDGKLLGVREISGADSPGGQGPPVALFGAAPGRYEVRVVLTEGVQKVAQVDVSNSGVNAVVINW